MPEVRLIDANAFLKDVLPECKYPDALREAVERQPTIEPEVRHGYWYIERKNAMSYGCTKCSNCHVAAALRGQAIAPNEYYCKNCGSKNSVDNELLFCEQGGVDNGR